MQRSTRSPRPFFLFCFIASLFLIVGAPAMADGGADLPAVDGPAAESATQAPEAQSPSTDAAEWGGPEAPLMQEIEVDLKSGTDCDSPQGYCSSSGQCWSFCRALTGQIGICHQQYNCCVCPEVPGF